jgi:hypothetical protein
MAAPSNNLSITSLRGGLQEDMPIAYLTPDSCLTANNVEFFLSALGERRTGCTPVDITSSDLEDEAEIVHLSEWFPLNDPTISELWAIGATPGVSTTMAKRTAGVWSEVVPVDAITTTAPNVYQITSQTGPTSKEPIGKLFWAYPSAVDRLHVYDTNNPSLPAGYTPMRRVGIAQPSPPTVGNGVVTNTGITTTRYYRIRLIREAGVGSTVTTRSEPSTSVAFTPDGVHAPRITAPVFDPNESGTNWEVEGSFDNVTFYRIQTLSTTTPFWDDTFTDPNSFSQEGPLSELIGAYLLLPSAKYIITEGDRLILGGHWTDAGRMSTVWWTPVSTDPGQGNDERLPLQVNNFLSLDNYNGGGLTGLATGINGAWYAFKWDRIYKMNRTGDVTNAYVPLTLTTTRGAIPGSIVNGEDQYGSACIYFLDPKVGPCMLGTGGLFRITGIQNKTWKRVNLNASIVARGVYYSFKNQIKWWIAVDGSDTPNLEIVNQVSELQQLSNGGMSRGWSLATGRISQAYSVAMVTETVTENSITSLTKRPFVGLTTPDYIQRTDGAGVSSDAGVAYVATMRSIPFFSAGLLNKWGAMVGSLFADAVAAGTLVVRFIRDMGVESSVSATVDLTPASTETQVVKIIDQLNMSNAASIQVEFSDQ